jgi:dynein heavy chain
VLTAKSRYEVGLQKLDSAAGEVSVMQEELVALQPQLVVAADQVQELVAKVEKESADVADVSDLLIYNYFIKFHEDFMYLEISSVNFLVIEN